MLTVTTMSALARDGAVAVFAWTRPHPDAALEYGIERATVTTVRVEVIDEDYDGTGHARCVAVALRRRDSWLRYTDSCYVPAYSRHETFVVDPFIPDPDPLFD